MGDSVFFVSQVGARGSAERNRADEVHDGIVVPVAEKFRLSVRRADRDPTPGQVTTQIVRALIEARVVVADLTGRNPNVYYELGVAHAFQKPVAILVDKAASLSFDTQNEKVVEIGDAGIIGVNQARDAVIRLTEVFEVVLAPDYSVENLLTSVAVAQSLDALAPDNPVASEVAAIREQVEEMYGFIRRAAAANFGSSQNFSVLRHFVQEQTKLGKFTPAEVGRMMSRKTSPEFDAWLVDVMDEIPAGAPPSYSDEEPF